MIDSPRTMIVIQAQKTKRIPSATGAGYATPTSSLLCPQWVTSDHASVAWTSRTPYTPVTASTARSNTNV